MITRRCPHCHRQTLGAHGPRVNWLCPHCGSDLLWLADPKPVEPVPRAFRHRGVQTSAEAQPQPAAHL